VSRLLSGIITALGVIALPAIALACPVCAQNTPDTKAFAWLMMAMIFLPFPVVGVVAYIIKHGGPNNDGKTQLD